MALRFLSTRLSSTAPLCSSTAPFLRPALPLFARVSPTNNPPTTPRTRTFATTTSKMSSTSALVDLAKNRRTIYKLGKTSPVSDSQIEELVNAAITHVPSSFNTQSTRLLVLLHQEHEKLWDIVIDMFGELVKTGAVPEELWKNQTLPKLKGMQAGVGTVCFSFISSGKVSWVMYSGLMENRSYSTKTPRTSSRSQRSSLSTRITSSHGLSTPTPCTSISVRRLCI